MTVASLTVEAKNKPLKGDSPYEDKITFVKEKHLFRGSDGLTVMSFDLEWPEVLNHSTSPGLQKFLCTTLFGNNGTSLNDGMEKFLRSKGNEITQMPDNPGAVNHISIELYGLLWEKYKYISFRYAVSERDNTSPEDSIRYGFLTYDMMNDKILTSHDIFRDRFFPGNFDHDRMVEMVLARMDNTEEFRLEDIPSEAFLIPGGVVLALEDVSNSDGYISLISLPIHKDEFYNYLKDDARKLLKGKPEARMASSTFSNDNKDVNPPEPGIDPTYIYKVVEEKPDLEQEDLSIDSYLAKNAKYPIYEEYSNISGKVVLQFVVEADGSISQVSSVRPITPGLAREAVRVLRDTPKWKPAKIKGIPVRSLCNVAINFAIK